MNIFNNNSQHTFQNRNGNLNISGNNNQIYIKGCVFTISVNGNGNNIFIENSRLNAQVNGNLNNFHNNQSHFTVGINGSNNTIENDRNTHFICQFVNGVNNNIPNFQQNNQQRQPRNRSNQRNNQNRNTQRTYNNQPNNFHQNPNPYNQQQNNFRNGQNGQNGRRSYNFNTNNNMQNNGVIPPNFMHEMQRTMGQLFNMFSGGNQQNQPNMYGNRPNVYNFNHENGLRNGTYNFNLYEMPARNRVFVFNNQAQQMEHENGLNQAQCQLLPISKHEGPDVQCIICMQQIKEGQQQTFLMCFHSFHWDCIKDWMHKNSKCPICKFEVKQGLPQ